MGPSGFPSPGTEPRDGQAGLTSVSAADSLGPKWRGHVGAAENAGGLGTAAPDSILSEGKL